MERTIENLFSNKGEKGMVILRNWIFEDWRTGFPMVRSYSGIYESSEGDLDLGICFYYFGWNVAELVKMSEKNS